MAFKMMVPVACILVVLFVSNEAEAAIGMNWGRQSAQRLVPSQVVDLLLQNGIGQARVYTSEKDILEAFAGSGINLTVTIFNATAMSTIEEARKWIRLKNSYFYPSNIRAVYVGSYALYSGLENKAFRVAALNSLRNVQNALNEAGYGEQMKAMFDHHLGELKKNITKPSEAEFVDEIMEELIPAVRLHQENKAPFVISMFPIRDVDDLKFDPSFAFPDNKSTQVITDINGAVYTNMFDFTYDCFVWALKKISAADLKIIVGQIGWPTDGYPGADTNSAERFFKGLLPMVASNKGTPMRPGVPIDIYVHALTDENRMPYSFPFTRHWGIYRTNGVPKYKIDLSGQGRDIFPSTARGIMRMPQRWCVFNEDNTHPDKVKQQFDFACAKADCTSLSPGASCSQLSFNQNISYAFNMHFQFHYQDEKSCDFGGLARVSVDDPSTGECVFPVEVVRGQQSNFKQAGRGLHERPNCAAFVFLLSILVAFIWN